LSAANYQSALGAIAGGWLKARPVYLDTETTGLGPDDEVVEIAVIDHDGTTLIDQRVRPTVPIPIRAFMVHGICDEDVSDSPTFAELAPKLEAALRDRVLVIYNANFDLRILAQSARIHACRTPAKTAYCAMELYAAYRGDWNPTYNTYRWHKLATAAQHLGVSIEEPLHSARADAEITRRLVHAMSKGGQAGMRQ